MWKYVLLLLSAAAQESLASPHQHFEALERFREYLKIRTDQPTPDYAAAATFLIDQAEDMKLPYEKFEFVEGKPVIVIKWAGQQPELESLMLNSHIDVVPAEESQWKNDPFSAEVDELSGNIYARGAQDMKCVGMQYLEAIRRLQAAGYRPLRTVYVTFVPDEEVGGKAGMLPFTESDFFQTMKVGVSLDEGWATPEEVYPVFYAERTPWWLVIHSSGDPGHGSKLYDNSAMEGLLWAMNQVYAFRAEEFDKVKAGHAALGEVTSINLAYVKGGVPAEATSYEDISFIMNLQPASAEAGFDMRLPPTADYSELERRIAQDWAPANRNLSHHFIIQPKKRLADGSPAMTRLDDSNPWWRVFEGAVARRGGSLSPQIFPAATDASYLRALGIPCFGFSPMLRTPKLLHEHNEFLNKDIYESGIEMYMEIITAMSSYRLRHTEL